MSRLALVAGVALIAAACGGTEEATSDTRTTTSPATTAAQTSTTTTPEPSTTIVLAEQTQTLAEYLADYFDIRGDFSSDISSLPEPVGDQQGYSRELADAWTSLYERMLTLDPPPQAQAEHARGITAWGDFAELIVLLGEAVAESSAGADAQVQIAEDAAVLAVEVLDVEAAINVVAAEALRGLDTDLSNYMAEGWALRDSFAPLLIESGLLALNDAEQGPETAAQLRVTADAVVMVALDWSGLDAPAEVALLQDDQAFLFEATVNTLMAAADAIDAGEGRSPDVLELASEVNAVGMFLDIGWAYATAAVFRGDDEALLAYLVGVGTAPSPPNSTDTDVFSIGVGTCFDDAGDDDVFSPPVADCDDPHDNEVFFSFDVENGPFPGDGPMDDLAGDGCFEEFEPFVGMAYEESELFLSWFLPSEQSWAVGDRAVLCFVWQPDKKLTGTMEGSGL